MSISVRIASDLDPDGTYRSGLCTGGETCASKISGGLIAFM